MGIDRTRSHTGLGRTTLFRQDTTATGRASGAASPISGSGASPAATTETSGAAAPVKRARTDPNASTTARHRARAGEDLLRQHLLRGADAGDDPSIVAQKRTQTTPAAGATSAPGTGGPELNEGMHTLDDGSRLFVGTNGADHYTVSDNSGGVTITNDDTGAAYSLSAEEASHGVGMYTAGGDDVVTVAAGVGAELTIDGGADDDILDGGNADGALTLQGGSGNNRLTGGSGDDRLVGDIGEDRLEGGDGMDSLEGGADADELLGGAGRDQVLGGSGDDIVSGNDGDDVVSGGQGADTVYGGDGADAIYADAADQGVHAGGGSQGSDGDEDLIVAENGTVAAGQLGTEDVVVEYDPAATRTWLDAHPEVVIEGRTDFVQRTEADIGAMLATQQGKDLLDTLTTELSGRGESLTIAEKEGAAGGTYSGKDNRATVGAWAATYGDGAVRHPLPVLFHELVHAHQDLFGTGAKGGTYFQGMDDPVENDELQTTGVDWNNGGTVESGDAYQFTDNKFRRELGLTERVGYSGSNGNIDLTRTVDEGWLKSLWPF